MQQYYELAGIWKEDATLAGSGTMLRAAGEAPAEDECNPISSETVNDDTKPYLVIPDSRGRIRSWNYLRSLPYWGHFVALCSQSTQNEYLQYLEKSGIDYIIIGEDHVDLRAALLELNRRYDIQVVRVDAGGTLNRELFARGLIDEISLLVCPYLVGGKRQSGLFIFDQKDVPDAPTPLKLMQVERLKGDAIWLRYEIK